MCGILVVLSKKDELNITLCDKALDKLRLRGPDFSFKELYCNNC